MIDLLRPASAMTSAVVRSRCCSQVKDFPRTTFRTPSCRIKNPQVASDWKILFADLACFVGPCILGKVVCWMATAAEGPRDEDDKAEVGPAMLTLSGVSSLRVPSM